MPQDQVLSGARILIAEDNAIQAFDLKASLQEAGAEVVGVARTLAEAFDLASSPSLTCAILDVTLRGEPVFLAAKLLKERGISIIFLTGGSDLPTLTRDWPEAQVVSKPAPIETLLQAIARTQHRNQA